MKRNDFLRNAMMALAISFVPKVLQPLLPEVIEETFDVKITYWVVNYDSSTGIINTETSPYPIESTFKLNKSTYDYIYNHHKIKKAPANHNRG